jgi:hypothetical protein
MTHFLKAALGQLFLFRYLVFTARQAHQKNLKQNKKINPTQ